MKSVVDVGLPPPKRPFSWAVVAADMLFTAHGPVREDGSIDAGPVEDQARLTLSNLRRAVEAAGGTLDDVTQVLIYLTDPNDMPVIDAVYQEFFRPPFPNRSSAAVMALLGPGMKLEIVAYAMIAPRH